ncbi:mersacidin/lichenicidin family type 2 lantibiotic [Thermosporothrix hazakensis]|uniref:Mersacidin/lichenicidin family type 2 lantibiotic n=2 Tax=Thermosporothrix TaxID=768650 RepID=A0A326UKY5_THEHA|nr:mersacidin/lichenicidin family type 2 lantibiotic [Thermosporothrix hazakensis]PZW29567.1 mersacidin/lichenicidin family type 2 lantibiotic [Thermosporothrix hazakensis]BBH85854.1 hypothetical protein KTC_06050 [Thermosporothrix sp. COM3]GCE45719.1 hypothetical protein KTH_05880 [Thermosporothrix hazakensis]
MNHEIIRAWKDASYRKSLSSEDLANLPENPAGAIELSDAELESIQGGHHHHRKCCLKKNTEINTVAVICAQSLLILNLCITMGTDCIS